MRWLFAFVIILIRNGYAEEISLLLGNLGSVRYTFQNEKLCQVDRLSPSNEVMYTHRYIYNEKGHLIAEDLIRGLGKVEYEGDRFIRSPYGLEKCEYDEHHHLVKHTKNGKVKEYLYDHDKLIVNNGSVQGIVYDCWGNIVQIGKIEFSYDEHHRLTRAKSAQNEITYEYDEKGRRISKAVGGQSESYMYLGTNEIAIIDDQGLVKELRIPGLSPYIDILRPIAIETADTIYAPVHDVQGNIRQLIDVATKEIIDFSDIGPFGENLPQNAPTSWILAGKHYEKEVGLVYFASRYYSPNIRQWLTPDPACQSFDPYEYCLGNPFAFIDPDGQFAIPLISLAWGAGTVLTSPIWGPYAVAAALGTSAAYLGYKGYAYLKEKTEKKRPPYTWDDLGSDPSKCPDQGFKWKGKGMPESGKGNWVRGEKPHQEKLNPDLGHPDPIGPHWDYEGPDFPNGVRIKPDGTWEIKPGY